MNTTDVLFTLYVIFLIYFLTVNFVYLVLLGLAFTGSVRRLYEARFTDFELLNKSYLTTPVSIVIPAFNEETSVTNAVYSAINLIYPEFEVIIVNDGSTDNTLAILEKEFELAPEDVFYPQQLITQRVKRVYRSMKFPNLWIIDKENGGKADAVNAGVNMARYQFITITDADSIFQRRGILRIGRIINSNPGEIVAVGGQLRIGNGLKVEKGKVIEKNLPRELVAKFQVVEYLGSFLGNRVGWSELNSVLVIAGGYGLWRRDAFMELGGMTTETTHEDIEFTFRIHDHFRRNNIPYKIDFLPDPIVWTEVPASWRGIFVQRRRWQRVVNEVAWRYKRMFLNPKYGSIGMIGMPYLVLFESLGPIIEVASFTMVVVSYLLGYLSLNLLLLFLLISFGLTSINRIASVFVEQYSFRTYPLRSLPQLFLLAVFENIGYHQVITIARFLAFFDSLFGVRKWERVERRGFAQDQPNK